MSVTAVPLQPLGKGTIAKLWIGLAIVVLLGVALAWIGTSRQQFINGQNGITYRIYEAGDGDPVTPQDIALVHAETIMPDGEVRGSTRQTGQPQPLTAQSVPPWLNEIFLQMREGASYQLFVPARVLLEGQPPPPGEELKEDDSVEFRIEVVRIERDGVERQRMQQMMQQQMMQQMMEQQGGQAAPGGGAPGGPAPGRPPAGGPGGR